MDGNSNTDPAVHFMGTTDSADFVLKSNGQEMIRMKGNGEISLLGALQGSGPLFRNANGTLRLLDLDPAIGPVEPCVTDIGPIWTTAGNNLTNCSGCVGLLGSVDDCPLRFATHNIERMRLTSGGHLQLSSDLDNYPIYGSPARLSLRQGWGNWMSLHRNADAGFWALHNPENQDHLEFYFSPVGGDAYYNVLDLHNNGKVSMGTAAQSSAGMRVHVVDGLQTDKLVIGDVTVPSGYRLYVQEGILTDRVKVALHTESQWSDHVFKPGYRLMPLQDVAAFINEHGHLPGVPSAAQMVEQGLDVVKTDAMLMEKIEEVTLHLIAMEKRVAQIEEENTRLRSMVAGQR